MDTISKLVDVFINWTKKGKRWLLLPILLLPGYFVFFEKYYEVKFRQVFEIQSFLWISAITVGISISLYIFFGNYERIAYSRLVGLFRIGRRVSVTKPLAWHTLTYDKGGGNIKTVTVVKELSTMLRGLGIHPVVIPQPKGTILPVTPRDQFVLDGVVSTVGSVVRSVVVLHYAQSLQVVNRLMQDVVSSVELADPRISVSVPLKRIFDLKLIIDMYIFELSIPAGLSSEQQTAITRLFIGHALMTMLYRDGHPAAKRVARNVIDVGELLAPIENDQIAKIYKAAAFNLVTQDEDFSEAIRALRIAAKAASADSSIVAMLITLNLKLGQIDEASQLIARFEQATADKALLCWLKADYFMSSDQPDEAIASFEEAIAIEPEEEHRATMHFNAAFAYALAKKLKTRQQADAMIRHLEDAVQLEDNPVFHVIKGFGWALRGNQQQFESEFTKAEKIMEDDGTVEDHKPFVEYWKARGLRKLGHPSKVTEQLTTIVGSPEESLDADNLLVLAGAALDQARVHGDSEQLAAAERYLDRVIQLEPNNGEAFKYRGVVYAIRCKNSATSEDKARFGEKAREDLLKSIRLGHEMPASHEVLGGLYHNAGDMVNAARHWQRWLELSPNDPNAIAYQALAILDESGDLAKAMAHLEGIEGESDELATVYRLIAKQAALMDVKGVEESDLILEDAKKCLLKAIDLGEKGAATYNLLKAIHLRLGEIYRNAGRLNEAADSYAQYLKNEPTSFTANGNLAFVLFEQDKYAEALRHWEQALQTSPDDADANAGKAAALHSLGKDDQALSSYKRAVSLNNDFLEKNIMRDKYVWSDKALEAVSAFISQLKDQAI